MSKALSIAFHLGFPNLMEDCPARMGKNCPESFLESMGRVNISQPTKAIKFVRLFETSNPELLKLLSVAAACGLLLIAFIQILRFVTFMLVL
ncbi:unnamed protein product [Rodentolepis nana]|uniref:Uncharacterized protein n=1 Tax=Rodentolepis nana TaxID=102285 RepID=A0A0R3T095_RODNA|nr:unnamed protein product [Rodentolepis nana]